MNPGGAIYGSTFIARARRVFCKPGGRRVRLVDVRAKLIVWLALAVGFTTVQCISACTFEACSQTEKLPPCHRHQDSRKSEPCSHQAVLANAFSLPPAPIAPVPVLAGVATALPVYSVAWFPRRVPREDTVWPPGLARLGSVILRI